VFRIDINKERKCYMKVLIRFESNGDERESPLDQVKLTTWGGDINEHLGYFFLELMKLCGPIKQDRVLDILTQYMDQDVFDRWYESLDHSKLIELTKKQDQ
jgi:hypothetical protein